MNAQSPLLLVVDVQERLLAKIPQAAEVLRNSAFLIDVATLLQVPIVATEQYPKGLGPTHPEIARRLATPLPDKVGFSCCSIPQVRDRLSALERSEVVLVGIEAHVCILQTAQDLLAEGYEVHLVVDAVASRHEVDQTIALRRLERLGVILTTTETVTFEWLGSAAHPQFKAISALVKERDALR